MFIPVFQVAFLVAMNFIDALYAIYVENLVFKEAHQQ